MDFKELGLESESITLIEDIDELNELSGEGWTWNLVFSSVVTLALGNNGYVCTWTHECQANCK
ncbi:plantaricin C family lantibiotic [Lactococcus hircilactis]|uniref:Plantaricin C family lantibiotic n=1 Tax=Lactococcus hircilactis TaxID=1494462 RepID=A0A7X2CZI8_9LACT|nr:plantaricin C family lantibiotic [Lactococcus hircilactis]MQW38349.1 plantaricin C family lantibiotic [Lactococcus hircilactis]